MKRYRNRLKPGNVMPLYGAVISGDSRRWLQQALKGSVGHGTGIPATFRLLALRHVSVTGGWKWISQHAPSLNKPLTKTFDSVYTAPFESSLHLLCYKPLPQRTTHNVYIKNRVSKSQLCCLPKVPASITLAVPQSEVRSSRF